MHNKLVTFIAMSASIFTASAAEQNPNDLTAFTENRNELALKGELPQRQKNILNKNVGHFTFTIAPTSTIDGFAMILPVFLVGYQSAIYPSGFFDSASVEFGGGGTYKERSKPFKFICYHPKLMGVKYLDPYAESRHYASYGVSLLTRARSTSRYGRIKKAYGGTFLAPSLAAGVELGSPNKAVSKIQLSIDQPLIAIYENDTSLAPIVMLSYSVGF